MSSPLETAVNRKKTVEFMKNYEVVCRFLHTFRWVYLSFSMLEFEWCLCWKWQRRAFNGFPWIVIVFGKHPCLIVWLLLFDYVFVCLIVFPNIKKLYEKSIILHFIVLWFSCFHAICEFFPPFLWCQLHWDQGLFREKNKIFPGIWRYFLPGIGRLVNFRGNMMYI